MPIPTLRKIVPTQKRFFGRYEDALPVPNLIEVQIKAYERFLQPDVPPNRRQNIGLEALLRETFPIENHDRSVRLEYLYYELGKPRFGPDDCAELKLTYGRPFRVFLRLHRGDEVIEEDVYLGDIPIMTGGGEFIINGAQRVVVSQLHRSPGVDFTVEVEGDRKFHGCRIIPERGSWIEINVATKKDVLAVRIDQTGKFPVTMLLRAMSPKYSTDADILRAFYPTEKIPVNRQTVQKLVGRRVADDVVDPKTGEIFAEAGTELTPKQVDQILLSGLEYVEVLGEIRDMLILNTIHEDKTKTHEEALLRIYQRMRPGNPPQLEKAMELFRERFFDPARYRLGQVGRFRMNRKLGLNVPETEMTLSADDLVHCIRYIMALRDPRGQAQVDDIDHLGNRRVRTIDELAADEIRKGLLKLRRTVLERMQMKEISEMTPRTLINPRHVSAAVEYFFGRGELSQVVDQTNPLSQLTHERRLSALGPGGLNRKRAGFEARDVHISHYGRICPIETPEGTNIGLITSMGVYARINEYGFLITPYRRVRDGKVTDEIVWMRADEEAKYYIAPADAPRQDGKLLGNLVQVRKGGELTFVSPKQVEFIDVSTKQIVGVSAGLIPFLEHDDANRALMGANMQRQAVPLLETEPPLVATGLETEVPKYSGMVVRADRDGYVVYVDGERIIVADSPLSDEMINNTRGPGALLRLARSQPGAKEYVLRKFRGLNEKTCLNQKPIVTLGQRVKAGQIIADGPACYQGELALGRNVLVAFMSWEGYNFEDAIIISERLVHEDIYTSIHITEHETEIRETKLGKEEFTRDIPNESPRKLANLDEHGVVRVGTYVRPGDILVGKIAPKSRAELTPEEKLLHAIFGRAGEDVRNVSLEVPPGIEGIVIHAERYSRRASLSEEERKELDAREKEIEQQTTKAVAQQYRQFVDTLQRILEKKDIRGPDEKVLGREKDEKAQFEQAVKLVTQDLQQSFLETLLAPLRSPERKRQVEETYQQFVERTRQLLEEREAKINYLKRGEELPQGVQQMVKVWIATKRRISVGDKMAGRHGNKGVIAKILPVQDMPFLEDGTPVDIILNPLGVPSRMNVGQILETHLGWAAAKLGFRAITPVFDGATEEEIRACLKEAQLPVHGKVRLYDGRTGEPFDQEVTVGYLYMMKLHHLVDDKIHARATGPYSLITQQPLGGKARAGGQRFGEMEVWALEAYGAAYMLQELLTVKSDDMEGRSKIYESIVKGRPKLEPGTPASFEVLTHEIKGLGLNVQLIRKQRLLSSLADKS
ncbi:MAG: DNA-directed RNA polymerase subunit beta [Gemmatales bacterium]|nr:DNA-directed RNA polymerase subunit beta [Gemmatales bacterium]MDW7995900.1 DNA-directed RNA polymerase subunit beta [Gemmatales bacterium]